MAARPLLILHGWSDKSASFANLQRELAGALGVQPRVINLADFLTLDDEVTYDDLAEKMTSAWNAAGLPTTPYSVDVVVHSTGGLVLRHWLALNYKPENAPIKHLVMLAPANAGSPLAHKGWSFIGRVFRGNEAGGRASEVGKKLLQGLEMASEFSYQLAMRDRFGPTSFYEPGKILCTVLVGNRGYKGLSGMVNMNGSDGTVYVSTANMNCARLRVDFETNPLEPHHELEPSNGKAAFGVVQDANHKTITLKEDPPHRDQHLKNIVRALTVPDAEFEAWCAELDEMTRLTMINGEKDRYTHGYQNTVVRVSDQYGTPVLDYTLEFTSEEKDPQKDRFAERFHQEAIDEVHPWSVNRSYQSLIVDCTVLHKRIDLEGEAVLVSLTAEPQLNGERRPVGYRTYSPQQIGDMRLDKKELEGLFVANHTLFVDLKLRREQEDSIFQIHG